MGANLEDMAKMMEDKKELIAEIEKNTTHLQDDDLGEGRKFTSYTVTGMEGYPDTYCSIDTADMEQSISKLVDTLADDNLKEMFSKLRGQSVMRMAFSVTVSKSHTTVRVIQGGEVSSTSTYTNVQSADDVLKLVSFHTAEFVDPMLKDFETIKRILGK
jgi:hypothetical protein